jgi:hypothetical protein
MSGPTAVASFSNLKNTLTNSSSGANSSTHKNSGSNFGGSASSHHYYSGTRARRVRSQYPADSAENHVEYILVASFDIDRGSIMEHQYPGPISGDEHMLAELMLPDQAHVRSQDWTVFFLHKDTSAEDEAREERKERRRRRQQRKEANGGQNGDARAASADQNGVDSEDTDDTDDDSSDGLEEEDDDEGFEGPPLIYVLNLVNTKQDQNAKRCACPARFQLHEANGSSEVLFARQWRYARDIHFFTFTR